MASKKASESWPVSPAIACAKAGAVNVVLRPVKGAPVDALLQLVTDVSADLLVVGNRGLNSIAGRLLGSVPADVARKSASDVLIVHTT